MSIKNLFRSTLATIVMLSSITDGFAQKSKTPKLDKTLSNPQNGYSFFKTIEFSNSNELNYTHAVTYLPQNIKNEGAVAFYFNQRKKQKKLRAKDIMGVAYTKYYMGADTESVTKLTFGKAVLHSYHHNRLQFSQNYQINNPAMADSLLRGTKITILGQEQADKHKLPRAFQNE